MQEADPGMRDYYLQGVYWEAHGSMIGAEGVELQSSPIRASADPKGALKLR